MDAVVSKCAPSTTMSESILRDPDVFVTDLNTAITLAAVSKTLER